MTNTDSPAVECTTDVVEGAEPAHDFAKGRWCERCGIDRADVVSRPTCHVVQGVTA